MKNKISKDSKDLVEVLCLLLTRHISPDSITLKTVRSQWHKRCLRNRIKLRSPQEKKERVILMRRGVAKVTGVSLDRDFMTDRRLAHGLLGRNNFSLRQSGNYVSHSHSKYITSNSRELIECLLVQ